MERLWWLVLDGWVALVARWLGGRVAEEADRSGIG